MQLITLAVIPVMCGLILASFVPVDAVARHRLAQDSANIKELGIVALYDDDRLKTETSFAAFSKDLVVVGADASVVSDGHGRQIGTKGGFGIFRITEEAPFLRQISFFSCKNAGLNDVAIWRHFVFLAVANPSGGDCLDDHAPPPSSTGGADDPYNGVYFVDISRPSRPRKVGFVRTSCAPYTMTPYYDSRRVLLYAGGSCPPTPFVQRSSGGRMEIIRFVPRDPGRSHVASRPAIGPNSGFCWDIGIFVPRKLMSCGSRGRFSLHDLSDPLNPRLVSTQDLVPPAIEAEYSTFTWDGRVLVVSSTMMSANKTCSETAIYFYDVTDAAAPRYVGQYSLPRTPLPPTDGRDWAACLPWVFHTLPTEDPKRYIGAVAYLYGGLSIVDFSDPAAPTEIAHHVDLDENGASATDLAGTYWYNGRLYGTEITTLKGIRVSQLDLDIDLRYFRGPLNPPMQVPNFK